MLVEEIMTREVTHLTPDQTLSEALEIARSKRIRHLPVLAGGRLVGLLSDRDIRDASPSTLGEGLLDTALNTPVEQLMVREVITCHPLDFVEDAAALLHRHRIGCLPVVTEGHVVGIISESDILHTLVEMMGVNTPTSRVEVEVPDRPGMLANIADLLRARRINASTVMVFPSQTPGFKTIVFRIRTMDPRRFIQDIEAAGYKVHRHPCDRPQEEV
jgi:acetoin utilization protein AcuB